MKCTGILLFLLVLLFNKHMTTSKKWKDSSLKYNRMLIRVIIHQNVESSGIEKLIEVADKSMVSKTPNDVSEYSGLIRDNDIILITNKLILWFSVSKKATRVIRSGGGLLAGMWEIQLDDKKKPSLTRMNPNTGYTKNLLLTGSKPGIKLFGSDVFGGYAKSKIVWGIEYAVDVKATKLTGTDIINKDRGAYSPMADEGVFVQFNGILGNSNTGDGIDSPTDTDPRKGIQGKTRYTLTYRIPHNRMEFITEVEFTPIKGNFGPISNAFLALYLPGHAGKDMVYASHPELIAQDQEQLTNIHVNKWFKNTVVSETYFYDVIKKDHPGHKLVAQTPPGIGRILCAGSPKEKIGMMCGYPNNAFLPKEFYQEFALELSDNQTLEKIGKFHTLNYKLITTPDKNLVLKEKEKLNLIMRYKLINAYTPLPDPVNAQNAKNLVRVKK